MKTLLILTIVFVSFISCNKNESRLKKVNNPAKNSKIEFVHIAKGNIYGYPKQMPKDDLVISDNESWGNLIAQVTAVKGGIGKNLSEMNIDFNKYTVLAVFDSVYRNGGHTIDITNVVESDNDVIVTVKDLHPKGNLTSVMTQPYEIVRIPRTNKSIIFNHDLTTSIVMGTVIGFHPCTVIHSSKSPSIRAKGYIIKIETLSDPGRILDTAITFNFPNTLFHFPSEVFTGSCLFPAEYRDKYKFKFTYKPTPAKQKIHPLCLANILLCPILGKNQIEIAKIYDVGKWP